MWKSLVFGTLLAGGIVSPASNLTAHAMPSPAGRNTHAMVGAGATPSSTPELLMVLAKPAGETRLSDVKNTGVALTGSGLARGIALTLSNTFHVYTYGPDSIDVPSPTSLHFDAASVVDGTYDVSVRSPSGRTSNVVTVKIIHVK